MLFHTLEFVLLFSAVLPFALWGNSKIRRGSLLAASYLFYMWFSIPLVSLLIFSSLLDFTIGRAIHASNNRRRKKLLLSISLIGNLGVLFFFKYMNWFMGSLNSICSIATASEPFPFYNIILPIGISFYTFQTLSYTIDVYRGKCQPTNSLCTFALYVAFFPQLVAGPIVRAAKLIPQLERGPRFVSGQFRAGIGLFVFGLLKKVVVADNIAIIADKVFADPSIFSGFDVLLGVYAFSFQIYCDFSGYTDMARGVAMILGYEIGVNFNFPYFAIGVRDFWRRWHISLSTWLRDYLYIPLGGNKKGVSRHYCNIMVTMLLGGLWHGANWTFVIWGGIHGIWIICEHAYSKLWSTNWLPKSSILNQAIKMLFTFHLVCFSWIFFRAETVDKAWGVLMQFLNVEGGVQFVGEFLPYIIPLLLVEVIYCKTAFSRILIKSPFAYWITVFLGIFIFIIFGSVGGEDFVYFQF